MAEVENREDGQSLPSAHLLLVVGEPFTDDLKERILQRITKELASWNIELSECDLNEELQSVAAKAPIGEDGQNGEKLVQHVSEKLRADFLINPTLKTLTTKLRGILLAPGNYRQIIFSGQVVQHSGCWVLQDGLFSFGNLQEILRGSDVSAAVKQGLVKGVLQMNVIAEGDWTEAHLSKLAPQLQVHLNPPPQAVSESAGFIQFCAYLSYFLKVVPLKDLLQSSTVVGNIRFTRPTLYIFPSCQGDSALFGISGFNLLVNGGYNRKACFWDFTRHLDRIDAMLITHLGINNLFGIRAVAARKAHDNVHPEIGFVYVNAIDKGKSTPEGETTSDSEGKGKKQSLLVSVGDEASAIVEDLKAVATCQPRPCVGVMQGANLVPTNLYHKVGHGTLDMYVLNPMQDGKVLKEFLGQWSKRGNGFTAKGGAVPHSHSASVCAILIWKPASPSEPSTRILFPGSAPQAAIFEGLDRLKNVALFQSPTGVEKDTRGAPAKKGATAAKPQAPKPAPGKSAPPPKQDAKKAPLKKEVPKADSKAPGKDEKTSDTEKKSSTPSSESKSPVDGRLPMASPGAASAASVSEGLPSGGGVTPDEDNKENEHEVEAATGMLIDLQSAPPPPADSEEHAAEEVEAEKPDPEEKDIDTKEGQADDGIDSHVTTGVDPDGAFDGVTPQGLPSPSDEQLLVQCSQADKNHVAARSSEVASSLKTSSQEADASVESFDPKKHWGMPMDLPAPNRPPGKSGEDGTAGGSDKAGMDLPRKKTSPTKPQAARPMGHGRDEAKDEGKNVGSGDASRKSSVGNVKKQQRPATAPSDANTKPAEPKSARGPAKKTAVSSAGPASKPAALKPVVPFYVDLAYIPGHGNPNYLDIDFFRRVRARYYVLSTINPDAGILTSLLEAKQMWDEPDLEVTIIPTYDADVLRYWMAAHRDQLNQQKIDVVPSANRCSIQLQDHETSCAAFRLEF